MAIEQNKMGLELYKVLAAKEYGYSLTMYDTTGAGTTTPLKAKWIYIKPVNFMLQLPDPDKSERSEVYFWKQKGEYDEIVEQLIERVRNVVQQYGVGLTVNDFERENAPKSFAKLVQRHNEEQELSEGVEQINESMSGSSYRSYYVLENARMIAIHSKRINEEVNGSRTRNIKEIFIECNGERFRYPTTYLHGAQAMTRHINQGGAWGDKMGTAIRESGRDIKNLRPMLESKLLRPQARMFIEAIANDMKRARGPRGYRAVKEKYEARPRIAKEVVESYSASLCSVSGLMEGEDLTECYNTFAKYDLRESRLNETLFLKVIQGRTGVDPKSAKAASRVITKGNVGFKSPAKAVHSQGDIRDRIKLMAGQMAESVSDDLISVTLSEIAQSDVTPDDAKFVMALQRNNLMCAAKQQQEPEIQQLMDWIERFNI